MFLSLPRLQMLLIGLVAFSTLGCGGLDQNDMRKYAIQRPPDPEDEEESSPPPTSTAAAPPAEQAPAAAPSPSPAAENAAPTAPPQAPSTVATAETPTLDAANTPDMAAANTSADPPPKPPKLLTPEDRAHKSAENMEKIAAALEKYREENGLYPPVALRDRTRAPLLSWRVELLPYLGHNDLYVRFDQKQPWYAPVNKALLAQIPDVYRSPERHDEKTNYQVPFGGDTIFQSIRTLTEQRVEDGLTNTVMLVEVDDQFAVNWTEPREFDYDPGDPKKRLGSLRGGQVFVVWGGGTMGAISMQASDEAIEAIFSADGGEPYSMASLNRPIDYSAAGNPRPSPATVAANAELQIAPSAPASTTASAARGHATATDPLAETYLKASAAALNAGQATDAWKWYYAALASGAQPPEFKWYPGLRRPTFGLHFAVAVVAQPATTRRSTRDEDAPPGLKVLEGLTEPYGAAVIAAIEEHSARLSVSRVIPGADPASAPGTRRGAFNPESTMTAIRTGSLPEVRDDAQAAGCDVLVVLEVDENRQRTNRALEVKIYDMAARRELHSSSRLNYSKLQDGRGGAGDDEAAKRTVWELEDLLADKLSPQPWPVPLHHQLAAKRTASLGASRDPYPPRVIAEVLNYAHLGLIDKAQVISSLEELLGEQDGTNLLLGNSSKRERVLRRWLPDEDAEQLIAMAERKSRSRDDD